MLFFTLSTEEKLFRPYIQIFHIFIAYIFVCSVKYTCYKCQIITTKYGTEILNTQDVHKRPTPLHYWQKYVCCFCHLVCSHCFKPFCSIGYPILHNLKQFLYRYACIRDVYPGSRILTFIPPESLIQLQQQRGGGIKKWLSYLFGHICYKII